MTLFRTVGRWCFLVALLVHYDWERWRLDRYARRHGHYPVSGAVVEFDRQVEAMIRAATGQLPKRDTSRE